MRASFRVMSCRHKSPCWSSCWAGMERCWRRLAPSRERKSLILSVNLGALGFLAEVRLADLYTTLDGWNDGCCEVDARALLHAEVMRAGALYKEYEALNDVVIAKGAIARMGDFSIHIFDQLAASFRADGVIVSTPTGSTAIIWPPTDRFWRPPSTPW